MSVVRQAIPVARPVLDRREAEAASRAVLSGWVTQGPEVHAFERSFAAAVGAPHACAVSNCTTAPCSGGSVVFSKPCAAAACCAARALGRATTSNPQLRPVDSTAARQ